MLLQGIWVGVLIGTVLQTVILFVILARTKWQKEVQYFHSLFKFFFLLLILSFFSLSLDPLKRSVQAMLAEERIRVWGGNVELPETRETRPSENIDAPV